MKGELDDCDRRCSGAADSEAIRSACTSPARFARLVLTVAVVGLLVYFVGSRTSARRCSRSSSRSASRWAFFVGANLLFNLAYGAWTLFLTIVGFVVGFVTFLVLDGNQVLRELDPRPWLWALIGGGGARAAALLPDRARCRERVPRLLARPSPASAGSACSSPSPSTRLDQPATRLGQAAGLHRHRRGDRCRIGVAAPPDAPQTPSRAALDRRAIGWLIGAWGGADLGSGSHRGSAHRHGHPARRDRRSPRHVAHSRRRARRRARSSSGRGPGSS